MSTGDDHWLDHAILDEGLGYWRLEVATGQCVFKGALWATLGRKVAADATLADFGLMVHDEDRGAVFDATSALIEGRTQAARFVFRMRPGQSDSRWLENRSRALTRDAAGRALVIIGSVTDCTALVDAKRAPAALEAKLTEVQNRFHSFLANTRDAVWCYECKPPIPLTLPLDEQFELLLDATLVDSNAPHAALHGVSDSDALLGQPLRALNRTRLSTFREIFRQTAANQYVLSETRLDDVGRNVLVRAQGVVENGVLLRIWGSYSDITDKVQGERDREQLEAQLRQSQKMESIGTLAGGMAHDFNNVLAAILAEADLGAHAISTGDPGELRESFMLIKKSAERGATLTRRLLAFARRRTSPRRAMRLDLLIHELWPMLRRLISERISLQLETPEPLWAIIDPSQIEQLIVTLVVNAREAIGEAGEIAVRVVPTEVGPWAVRAKSWVKPGAFVTLSVRDSGPGIDPALHDRIFEPFFSTKRTGEGTGLGLSMVYSILRQHEGFVEVHNAEGAGAQFDMYLPRVAGEVLSQPLLKTPIPSAPGHEKVLLVEDQPELRASAKRILESGGYQVVTAVDGLEAAEVMASAGPFGALVLDVVMPKRTGPQFYESLAEPRPPVLFTSGYSDGALEGPLFSGPGRGFVAKPYGREALLWALRSVLDSRE